jgi:NADH-quinone oxidoreductase subunit J
MSVGAIFFAIASVVCLVGALVTILAQNPIRGAVGLLTTIAGIAGLYLKLEAQFLAAIQLIVYAGAVVVLFVFVIMVLGPDAGGRKEQAGGRGRATALLAAALFVVAAIVAMVSVAAGEGAPTLFRPVGDEHGSVQAVGGLVFSEGLVAFELATALLIVAVVGAIAVARSLPSPPRKAPSIPSATRRLFGGPVHPRDATAYVPKEPTP